MFHIIILLNHHPSKYLGARKVGEKRKDVLSQVIHEVVDIQHNAEQAARKKTHMMMMTKGHRSITFVPKTWTGTETH